jgi:hypothetical protein
MMSDYHTGIDSISSTGLKMLLQSSPAHFVRQYTEEKKPSTKAQRFGIAAHVYLLEGFDAFTQGFVVEPIIDKRTKLGKAAYAEWLALNEGKQSITEEDFEHIIKMDKAFHDHPDVRSMMLGNVGQAEKTIAWRDPITGANCKCKPDWLAADTSFVIDLKTCESAHPDDVRRSIRRYMYHLSASFYLQGVEAERLTIPEWRWVFVEKKAPYAVAVYKPSDLMIDEGDRLVSRALDIYRMCRKRNRWDAFDNEAQEIDFIRYGGKND